MVPPWTPDAPPADAPPDEAATPPPPPPPSETAPPARFRAARTSFGNFARGGDRTDLERGLGHYVRRGYGGSGGTTQRFGGTASTAATLAGVLSALSGGTGGVEGVAPDVALNFGSPSGRSLGEVMDAIVEAVRPIDGTQDSEAARAAVRDALADLYDRDEAVSIDALSASQRDYVVEQYVAHDVVRRVELDLGQTIREKASSIASAAARIGEVRDYIQAAVAAQFRALREEGRRASTGRVAAIAGEALRRTFTVFESYRT